VLAAAGVVAVYLWDDLLLAAPIVAANRAWGTLASFLVFSVWYSVASLLIALWVVRASARAGWGDNRLSRWVQKQEGRKRTEWGSRLVHAGSWGAFVLASVVVGGILTTWFVYLGGRTQGIQRIAIASCVIFGVTFTLTYTLVGEGIGHL
jgi:hypothetical protein